MNSSAAHLQRRAGHLLAGQPFSTSELCCSSRFCGSSLMPM